MGVAEIRRLKQLDEENAKLKRLVADLRLDKTMLQDVLRKMYGPPRCCKGWDRPVQACLNVSGLRSVSRFWRPGHDEIRASGSNLMVRD